ncbi:MAG: DUF4254 domain-containing protein [Muribaculaceae bacterium]|nr:DUF4254 domain-containing protein [Muribaculaceae bacterium]
MTFAENCNEIFDRATADYHITDSIDAPAPTPYPAGSMEALLYAKNWIDVAQWHMEDLIRDPEIDPADGMVLKHRIDASNQDRTDRVEDIDTYFREKFSGVAPLPDATINTESPAWAIDRLSILAVKLFHMNAELERPDASPEHLRKCAAKLEVLREQRRDLTAAIDALRKLSAPMADEAEAHYRARKAALEALDLKMLATTPDVAPDKFFEALVAPHRGKVVMVDFWNTWCAPCRAAIAQNEPEKSGDLASDDIVWIYIADESSPMPTYMSMIKDIRGIHYRVDKDQIAALRNQFDVDGIPYYVLVDRSGRATGRPDLRNHTAFKKALQKAL